MKLKLQNIGIIEDADINIDGITLIAGQNDSGKSTVGKVLYALIRGINEDETNHNYNKFQYTTRTIRDIERLILRSNPSNKSDKKILETFEKEFGEIFFKFVKPSFIVSKNTDLEFYNAIIIELNKIKDLFEQYSIESLKEKLFETIEDYNKRVSISFDSLEAIQYRIKALFNNEFKTQINRKFSNNDLTSTVEIQNKKITFNKELLLKGFDESAFYYNDVTFIESPILLESKFHGRTITIPTDKKDYLNWKVFNKPEKELDIFTDNSDKINKFLDDISKIISGYFNFDEFHNLFYNKNEVDFELDNVATGIKTFGIIQILLKKGDLNSNSLLIIDEPEVHLHPTWQVKYAEILVKLSKEFAIPIVLTSHSPYFIEALEAYSKKYRYEESTNFYFAKKNEDGLSSRIIDVTENISPILSSISDAFYTIQDINDED